MSACGLFMQGEDKDAHASVRASLPQAAAI
jgi:hypothetical protein